MKSFAEFPGWDKKINLEAAKLYFKYGYVPSPYCIFQNFFKLQPAHFLSVNLEKFPAVKKYNYWNLKAKIINKKLITEKDENGFIEILDKKLNSSVKEKMNADVPLGAFLSGGLDSATIVALMNRNANKTIKTFTIGFSDDDYDETKKAKKVSQLIGTDHNDFIMTNKEISNIFNDLGDIWDEPFSDISQLPTLILSKITRNHVKVALSGDGGDELFCGYNRYLRGLDLFKNPSFKFFYVFNEKLKLKDLFFKILKEKNYEKLDKLFSSSGSKNINEYYENVVKIFDDNDPLIKDHKNKKLNLSFDSWDEYKIKDEEKLMYIDFMQYIPDDLMTKIDRASMAFGLETRSPFLDHKLVEYSFCIPLDLKKKKGKGKYILRKLLSKYLPRSYVESGKQGFSVPISQWIKGPMKDLAESLIDEELKNQDSIFNPERIRNLFNEEILS